MEVGMILVPAVKIRSFELEPVVVEKQHAFWGKNGGFLQAVPNPFYKNWYASQGVFLIVLQIATTTEEFVFILDSKDTFSGGVPCFEAKSSPDIGRLRRTVRTVHVIRILVGMSRCQKRLEVWSGQIKATSHDGFLPDVRTVSEFSFFQWCQIWCFARLVVTIWRQEIHVLTTFCFPELQLLCCYMVITSHHNTRGISW